MKKILITTVLTLTLLLSIAPIKAQDVEPSVTFDGSTTLQYNVDTKEFGKVFENMVPSQKRTLNIHLKNDSDKEVNFYMTTKVLEAFEDAKTASQGTYHVSLSLTQDGKETYIYGQQDGALVGANENGLYDLNGSLNEKYMIAKVASQKEATISLTVELDGMTLRNNYQGLPGMFQFDFTAQYDDTLQTPETIVKTIIKNIQTSDMTTIGIVALMLGIAGFGIGVGIRKGEKKNEK